MSEADALLDAIFDDPAEDTPRLVYADWLQEHDQENYAEFIRLQCAVAHCKVWSDEANELWVKIGRAWNRLTDEWWPLTVDEWPGLPGGWQNSYCLDAVHFERGFLKSVITMNVDQLMRYELCRRWFRGREARLCVEFNDVAALVSSPLLLRVRVLQCGSEEEDSFTHSRHFNPLLRSPELCRLRVLDLSNVPLQPSTVTTLLKAPNLDTLEEVAVGRHRGGQLDMDEAVLQLRSRFKRVIRH